MADKVKKVFNEFNPEMVRFLPVKDSHFIAQLTQQNLFYGTLKEKVMKEPLEPDAASQFLFHAVERSLDVGDTEPFDRLLLVMEKFGNLTLEKLAKKIKCKLTNNGTEIKSSVNDNISHDDTNTPETNKVEKDVKQESLPKHSITKHEASQLEQENNELKKEVDDLRKTLIELENKNEIVQIPLPSSSDVTMATKPATAVAVVPVPTASKVTETPPSQQKESNENLKEKAEKPKEKKETSKSEKSSGSKAAATSQPVDVSRCDFRVGKIVRCAKHPDADTMYVEEIDVGEEIPRTVISGLVKDYSLEEMRNQMVVVICNLKPRRIRGIVSRATVMCAFTTDPEASQFIDPPPGSVIGDRIKFKGYEGEPDQVLNPKKKIFEQIQAELHTDENCVAMYKGVPFTVPGKGICKTSSFSNCGIK